MDSSLKLSRHPASAALPRPHVLFQGGGVYLASPRSSSSKFVRCRILANTALVS